jgi:drug/metabolite transporter (DMT)-like permease
MRTSSIGYGLALVAAAISGFSIYVSSFAVRAIPDATLYTTLKNSVTGLLLLLPVFLLAKRRAELARISRRDAAWLVGLAIVGGSVPYVLFFTGLQMTTATTGSLLNHAQFIVVAVLAVPLLRERVTGIAWAGLGLLAAGSIVGSDLHALRLNQGAALVLVSTVLFGAGVVLTRRLLARLSPELVMSAKMSAGAALLIAYAAWSGHLAQVGSLSVSQWGIALATGLVLLAFTAATTYALRYAPALAVTAIGMSSPLITLGLQLAAGGSPHLSVSALWSMVLIVGGAAVFLGARRIEPAPEPAAA